MSIALRGDNPATPVGSTAALFATTQDRIRITGNADWATYRDYDLAFGRDGGFHLRKTMSY